MGEEVHLVVATLIYITVETSLKKTIQWKN